MWKVKIPQFWKVRNILFWVGRVLQNSSQKLGEFPPHSFSHLMCFDVPHMLGVWYILSQINWTELTMRRSAWPKHWPNVKVTWHSTALGHQMPLPWGYILAHINQTEFSRGSIIFPCPDHFISLSVLKSNWHFGVNILGDITEIGWASQNWSHTLDI